LSFLIELFYNLLGSVKIILKVNESYPLFPTNPLGGHTTPRFAALIQYVPHDEVCIIGILAEGAEDI